MTKTYKILLVDDDKFLLDMYANKFSKEGFEVTVGVGTQNALEKLKELKPDIILADIVMPGMDGLEFVEHVQKEGLAPDAIIIMLTNQGDSYDIERAKKLHVHGYIVKATSIPSEVVSEVLKITNDNGK